MTEGQMFNLDYPSGAKALIFDLDGTLVDTMGMHIDSWIMAGEYFGVEISSKMIDENAGIPSVPLVEKFNYEYGWDLDPYEFRSHKNELYLQIKSAKGVDPIIPVVEFAKTQFGKLPMAVGTGSIRENAIAALRALAIEHWFEAVVTADDVIQPKPHPETFLKGAQTMSVSPRDCHVFEDSHIGIKAAIDGGMTATNIVTGERFGF